MLVFNCFIENLKKIKWWDIWVLLYVTSFDKLAAEKFTKYLLLHDSPQNKSLCELFITGT